MNPSRREIMAVGLLVSTLQESRIRRTDKRNDGCGHDIELGKEFFYILHSA